MKKEEAHIEAEVQKRVAALMAEQQQQFAATMEMVMKNSVGALDENNANLKKELKKLEKELDIARELVTKAERSCQNEKERKRKKRKRRRTRERTNGVRRLSKTPATIH